jgi:hypothetical protein
VQGISLSGACEMDEQLGSGLYVAAMVAVFVAVDFMFFKNRFWND